MNKYCMLNFSANAVTLIKLTSNRFGGQKDGPGLEVFSVQEQARGSY